MAATKLAEKERKHFNAASNSSAASSSRENPADGNSDASRDHYGSSAAISRNANANAAAKANATANVHPASPCVLTDRSGVLIDSGIVSGVYGPPDGVDGSGGVPKGCGGGLKDSVGVPVSSDGAPGARPGQVPETQPMPSDGSNRASEGEQLWSPDPPTPSAGEVFSTIPATRMAKDNQLLKFANLQVVWYTSAISTIVPTITCKLRLQHGLVGSFVQDEKVNDNGLANLLTRMSIVSFQQISKEILRWNAKYQTIGCPGKSANCCYLRYFNYQSIIQFQGGC
jgi:hypothetical protein